MGNFISAIRAVPRLVRETSGIQRSMQEEGWIAARDVGPDLIVFNSKMASAHYAEKLDMPAVLAMPLPQFARTGAFPTIGFAHLPFGAAYNRLTYRVVYFAAHRIAGKLVGEWRREHALSLTGGAELMRRGDGAQVPVLNCFSEHVVPWPVDWPDDAFVTGCWSVDRSADWSPPPGLSDFPDA